MTSGRRRLLLFIGGRLWGWANVRQLGRHEIARRPRGYDNDWKTVAFNQSRPRPTAPFWGFTTAPGGTARRRLSPSACTDTIAAVSAGHQFSLALKSDGSCGLGVR